MHQARQSRLLSAAFLAITTLLLAGCGNKDGAKDSGPPPPDSIQPDILSPFDQGPSACGPTVYPCAPYGTNMGDVAANLEFLGFKDPNELCAAHKDKKLDMSSRVKVSFKDYFLGDGSCAAARKDLLWVMVSAGWCGPCQQEVQETESQYKAGSVSPRMAIMNIVFETDKPGTPIDEAFLKTWINAFGVTFPVVMDPTFRMGAYFNKAATPFNMLVETKTMKIYYRQTGGDLKTIGQQAAAYFSANP
jgi:hypothetical protein